MTTASLNFGPFLGGRQFPTIILSSSALPKRTRPFGADRGAEDGPRPILENI